MRWAVEVKAERELRDSGIGRSTYRRGGGVSIRVNEEEWWLEREWVE